MAHKPKWPKAEKHIHQIVPPKAGMAYIISNQVSNAQHHALGKNQWPCPVCGIMFHRPYSHVARLKGVPCCSRACSDENKKERFDVPCVVCGTLMSLVASNIPRIKACSRHCQSLKMLKNTKNARLRSLYTYRDVAKEIKKRGVCSQCEATTGPWAVRGITGDGYGVDASAAELWCHHCHMTDIAQDAYTYRQQFAQHVE